MHTFKIIVFIVLGMMLVSCSAHKELQDLSAAQKMEIAELKAENAKLKSTLEGKDAELDGIMSKLKDIEEVSVKGNRVVLTSGILFSSGSAVIKPEGKKILDEMWDILVTVPDREILIEGHTDNVPIAEKFQDKYKSNWELSSVRALAVLHYVSKHANATPSRLGAVGYGELRPVADNETEEGKLKNRRVEVVIGRSLK